MFKRAAHPEFIVAMAAAIWGLFWIPLRVFESHGLDPAWVILSQFIAPLALLGPFALWRLLRRQRTGIEQYGTGLLVGAGVVMYCESLLLTDVVRSLILFYAMPAWGTLVEVGLMGRQFTLWRGVTLGLSLTGLLTILGLGNLLSFSMNIGDLMALLSGIIFTFGAWRVRQATLEISVFEQVFAFFFFGSMVALALSLLPLAALGQPPTFDQLITLAPWIVLMAVGILIPAMWGLYWGSRYVDPGRLGILLQLEAVVGIGSAALLAGEPFGSREAMGALLVVCAGLIEVLVSKGNETADGQSLI
ncbi:MAG: DMT family transporter [Anaerolineae bacterium]|nr:DMT family transporter [Anaerolineae bacterium]